MIDYWEALGRLACDAQLNTNFEGLKANQKAPEVITIHARNGVGPAKGLNISGPDFNEVQGFWGSTLTEQLLSLISAGELIWTYSFQKSRDAMKGICQLIGQAQPKLSAPSTSYYIALGRIIVDDAVCKQLLAAKDDTSKLLPRLSPVERDQLVGLLLLEAFQLLLEAVRGGPWDEGCTPAAIFWPGFIQPMGINAEDDHGKFAFASRSAGQARAVGVY